MHRDVYVAQLCALLEHLADVNAEMVDGTHIWGFFRTAMYFPLVEAFSPDRVPDALGEQLAARFDAACASRGLPRAILTHSAVRPAPAHGYGPVVLAASGPSHHRVRNGLHESPVADAWTDVLIEEGHSVIKLDVLPTWLAGNQPRRQPGVGFPAVTEAERRRAVEIVRERWVPAIATLFARINPILQEAIGISLDSAVAACTERVVGFVAEREAAGRWLDTTRPRAVLFVCYYETCYLSLISACRARGIPTVDLQHGMNGTVHAAYTHWTAVPKGGYDVLPDWFLTWGEASSNNLRRWWTGETRHQALVGGRRDIDPLAPFTDQSEVAALAARSTTAARRILVTLQDEPLDAGLLSEMRNAPADWLWFVRPHPSSARHPEATAEAAARQLAAAGVTSAVVVPLTVGTLADLMRLADFHVTGTSSSWMDAWVYDVPTAFIHPGAGQVFATEIAEGLAYFAPRGMGLNAIISSGATGLKTTATAVVERSSQVARDALAAILGPAPRQVPAE